MKINTTYFKLKERYMYGSSRVGVRNSDLDVLPLPDKDFSMNTVHYSIGTRTYELSNHLGNVLSVISDKVIPVFSSSTVISEMRADIRVAQDYSPFGVTLDGRDFVVSEGYRYGYQGQESDDEVKGEGNSVNYKYRMHDPRIGRFFAVDPLTPKYPFYSPYSFSGNVVINAVELEGLEPHILFDSPDEAAINFGRYYNDNSIRDKEEYGAPIYKIKTDKGFKYAYTEASIGSPDPKATPGSSVRIDYSVPEGTEMVAWTHTHSNYVAEANNSFSGDGIPYKGTDIGTAIVMKMDAYVTTPNGTTLKFNYKNSVKGIKSIFPIDDKSPSDPTDPTNNSIPSNYENYIKLGNTEFNSDDAKESTKVKGVLVVTDIISKKEYGVVRNENGNYNFYSEGGQTDLYLIIQKNDYE